MSAPPIAASAPILYQPVGLARYRIKLTVAVFLCLVAGVLGMGHVPLNPLDFTNPWVYSGTMLVVVGLAIRSWAAGLLTKKEQLTTTGPYRLVRHPLYAGSTFMMCGFAVLLGHPLMFVATFILALALFGAAIRGEEKFLSDKFGADWKNYVATTGALFPKRFTLQLRASWTLTRWLLNREYNAWIGTFLGWFGLVAWHLWK